MPTTTPVRDVTTTSVSRLRPEQFFDEAAGRLAPHGIGAAPAVDADRHLVWILARGGVVRRVAGDR